MQFSLVLSFLGASLIASAAYAAPNPATATTPEVRRENTGTFSIDRTYLDTGAVQFFYELDLKNGQPDPGDPYNVGDAFREFLPFDIHGYWRGRGDEQYYVMMTKLAYVVDKDISTFTRAQTLDPVYMNTVAPAFAVVKTGPNRFHVPGAFLQGIPSADFTIDYVTPMDAEMAALPMPDPQLGQPDIVLVQHNFDFGTIMAARTSKMAMAFTYQYSVGAGRTLVVNYTFGYIDNVPPFFLGGIERVRHEAETRTLEVIVNLRNYRP